METLSSSAINSSVGMQYAATLIQTESGTETESPSSLPGFVEPVSIDSEPTLGQVFLHKQQIKKENDDDHLAPEETMEEDESPTLETVDFINLPIKQEMNHEKLFNSTNIDFSQYHFDANGCQVIRETRSKTIYGPLFKNPTGGEKIYARGKVPNEDPTKENSSFPNTTAEKSEILSPEAKQIPTTVNNNAEEELQAAIVKIKKLEQEKERFLWIIANLENDKQNERLLFNERETEAKKKLEVANERILQLEKVNHFLTGENEERFEKLKTETFQIVSELQDIIKETSEKKEEADQQIEELKKSKEKELQSFHEDFQNLEKSKNKEMERVNEKIKMLKEANQEIADKNYELQKELDDSQRKLISSHAQKNDETFKIQNQLKSLKEKLKLQVQQRSLERASQYCSQGSPLICFCCPNETEAPQPKKRKNL